MYKTRNNGKMQEMTKNVKSNINKVKTACNKHGHESGHMFQKFNLTECAAYLQFKCHENDFGMPKLVGERRKHCMEVMQYKSPTSSPHVSDVEVDWANDPSLGPDVIDALMGLSLSMMDVSVFEVAL